MQDTEVLNHTYENLVQRLQERERTINLISEEMEKLEVEVVHLRSENEDVFNFGSHYASSAWI